MREQSYALIHTHAPRAALVGRVAAALCGVPLVHHLHSPTGRDSTRRWQNRVNAVMERTSLSRAAAVVCVSHSLADYAAAQGIAREKIHVVPNGVPVLGPLAERTPPTGTWTTGHRGAVSTPQGSGSAAGCHGQARRDGSDVRLKAVGEFETPEYRCQIERRVADLGLGEFVEWTGFTQEVTSELRRMDLFVLPSLFGEGLPMVVLEAMAAGVPVVATRVEGVPEVIRDSLDGRLAVPGDATDLARVIQEFIAGKANWSWLRRNAHRRQAERFSARSMARGVAEIYQQVLDR